MIYNVCMGFPHSPTPNLLYLLFFGGSRVALQIATMSVDIACLLLVRKLSSRVVEGSNQVQTEKKHILNEIPMRSTMLNAVQMAIWFAMIPLTVSSGYSLQNKMNIGVTVSLLNLILKSPVIVFLTFRVNTENMRVNRDDVRERNRQLEIQEALERKEERRRIINSKRASDAPDSEPDPPEREGTPYYYLPYVKVQPFPCRNQR